MALHFPLQSGRQQGLEVLTDSVRFTGMDPANAPEAPVIAQERPLRMPVDWNGVRVLAIAVGVREAARRCGISEEAAMKRSQREGWLESPETRELNRKLMRENRTLSATVRTVSPAVAMANELSNLGAKTRLSIARGIAKAGAHIETMDGQEIVADAQNIKATAQTAQILHGWEANQKTSRVRLELLGTKGESMAIDVESEVVTDQDWSE